MVWPEETYIKAKTVSLWGELSSIVWRPIATHLYYALNTHTIFQDLCQVLRKSSRFQYTGKEKTLKSKYSVTGTDKNYSLI